MDTSRKANLPTVNQNNDKTTSSSSSSSPDFLRDVQAAFKRYRMMPRSNNFQTRRLGFPRREILKSSGPMIDSKADEAHKQSCDCRVKNMVDLPCLKCGHVLDGPKKVHFASGNGARSDEMKYDINNQLDGSTAPRHDGHDQSFHNMEVDLGSRSNDETSSLVAKGTTGVQNPVDPIKNFLQRDFGHQMTSFSVVGSNCATTTLVNSVNAPMLSSTTQNFQPSHHGSSHDGSSSDLKYQQMRPIDMGFNNNSKILGDQNLSAAVDPNPNNKCVLRRDQQGKEAGSSGMPNDPLLLVDKSTKGAGDIMDLQSQAPISNDQMYDVKPVSTESGKGTTGVQNQVDPLKNFLQRDFGHQMTSSSVVGSNCATTLVNTVNAPMLSSTTQNSQPSHHGSSHVGSSSDLKHQQMRPIDMGFNNNSKILADQNLSAAVDPNPNNKCVLRRDQQGKEAGSSSMPNDPHLPVDKSTKGAGDIMDLQSQAPISNDQMYDVKPVSTKSGKNEKHASKKDVSAPRKRNYDPDLFFKVNGKLYQRLGKIGSGGSSEVHKVISQDCKIYALKRIKLKGRDYATAYGFCQEIEYLNKLRGKDHIIQLIDYEAFYGLKEGKTYEDCLWIKILVARSLKVTDKALLKEVMSGSMSNKDGRVKDDGLIYMVLEYGEIDLAHMLSQKWKELDDSRSTIDENWLRFYWQQILLAVKTIHEERIVHSDLKPANFLLVRGSLKLIDFGIAKAILSDTTNIQRDSQVGTLSYMSPEAFLCNETDANGNIIKCGRPSDIWSLGCILYQMVYGRTPFADYTTFWAKFKVITDPNHEIRYGPLSNIWLLDLMKKCLAWERNERWTIPQLLQHPFLVPPIPSSVSNRNILQLVAESCSEDPKLLDEMSKLCLQLKEQRANSKCD